MYELKYLLQRGDPYASTKGGLVALSAGNVPDLPAVFSQSEKFLNYQRQVFELAQNVIMWWTPVRVEHEALRMAGDVEGPSVLSEEAYAFRAIHLKVASLIAEWVPTFHGYPMNVPSPERAVAKQMEMLRDLVHEVVTTLERKAQQVEARAMDLRLRYDAQRLRAMLAGLDVSTKLGELIEAAQRGTEAQEHLAKLAGELREPVMRAERALGSVTLVADWWWDRVIDKDAEAKKVKTTLVKVGDKATDAVLKAFFAALAHKLGF